MLFLKDKPIPETIFLYTQASVYSSSLSCFPLNYSECIIFNEIILRLRKKFSPRSPSDMSLECLLCSRSQASVDPDHEGHGPCHRGEVILGVPSQWEAQAVLHVAEERPAATLRGKKKKKLQPVLCHLPIFHFKDLICSCSSSFSFRSGAWRQTHCSFSKCNLDQDERGV